MVMDLSFKKSLTFITTGILLKDNIQSSEKGHA
jgi:hypothetical protein